MIRRETGAERAARFDRRYSPFGDGSSKRGRVWHMPPRISWSTHVSYPCWNHHYLNFSSLVYRSVYEVLVGPIPSGMVLDHLCGNPFCYNPAHLDPVTQGTNARRAVAMRKVEISRGRK